MRTFRFIASFVGFHCLVQVAGISTDAPPRKPRDFREWINSRAFGSPKQTFRRPPLIEAAKSLPPRLHYVEQERQIQRRDVPFQQTFLGVPVQIEKVHQSGAEGPGGLLPGLPGLPRLPAAKPLTKTNETEAERAERIHKSFDRLLTFVEIVGQVDNYVSSKWKNLVKTVSNFYEVEEDPYRVSGKRFYGSCPHDQ